MRWRKTTAKAADDETSSSGNKSWRPNAQWRCVGRLCYTQLYSAPYETDPSCQITRPSCPCLLLPQSKAKRKGSTLKYGPIHLGGYISRVADSETRAETSENRMSKQGSIPILRHLLGSATASLEYEAEMKCSGALDIRVHDQRAGDACHYPIFQTYKVPTLYSRRRRGWHLSSHPSPRFLSLSVSSLSEKKRNLGERGFGHS